ncbi:hypothetical protein OROHE_015071 [Orobanche hederae]
MDDVSRTTLVLCFMVAAVPCTGGTTSSFVRKVEKTVDMPQDSDVFNVPHGYIAPQEYDTKYYYELALMGDLGKSYDSNRTLPHYEQNPTKGQTVLFVGDLSYADNYPIHDSVRWDTGAGFVERSVAYQPWLWTAGTNLIMFPELGKYNPQYKWIEEELPKVNRSETPCILRGAGRSDYVVVTEDAVSFAFGWNRHGQLGSVSAKNDDDYAADAEEYEEKMEQEILLKSLQDFLGRLVVSNGGKMRVAAEKNSTNRKLIKDPHIAGPKSFARISSNPADILFCFSKQLGNPDNKPPSGAEIFTRKWDEKHIYKSAYDPRTFAEVEILCSSEQIESADQLLSNSIPHNSNWLMGRSLQKRQSKEKSST